MLLASSPDLNEFEVDEVLFYLGHMDRVEAAPEARKALQTLAATPPGNSYVAQRARMWLGN